MGKQARGFCGREAGCKWYGFAVLDCAGLVLRSRDQLGTKLVFRRRVFRRYFRCYFCHALRCEQRPQREKLVSARSASQRRQPQQQSKHSECAGHFFPRDALQLEVAANPASRIKKIPKRYWSGVKTRLTRYATPRNDTRGAKQILWYGAPPRTPAGGSLTGRTVHRTFRRGLVARGYGMRPFSARGCRLEVI